MALNKKIVKDSGLSVSYFRILNIEINYVYDISTITIEEYISEDYRNKAKKKAELLNTIAELEQQSNTTKDFKLKESLIEKINTIYNSNKELLANNYSTGINKVELDYVPEDLSISNFYNIIKNLDLYKDSKFI